MTRKNNSLLYAALLWLSIFVVDTLSGCAAPGAVMEFSRDVTAPCLRGTEDKIVARGQAVDYLRGVEIWDDQDAHPVLLVDTSLVRPNTPGSYPATYTASDTAGNQRTCTITVTVLPEA